MEDFKKYLGIAIILVIVLVVVIPVVWGLAVNGPIFHTASGNVIAAAGLTLTTLLNTLTIAIPP